MEVIKKNFFVIVFLMILGFSCNSKGDENFQDFKKVKLGMSIDEVLNTMSNEAKNIEVAYWSDSLLVERYESGFGASDDFMIIYSVTDTVVVEVNWGD